MASYIKTIPEILVMLSSIPTKITILIVDIEIVQFVAFSKKYYNDGIAIIILYIIYIFLYVIIL